eukprot:764017-Hanusia_phi.AAC.2
MLAVSAPPDTSTGHSRRSASNLSRGVEFHESILEALDLLHTMSSNCANVSKDLVEVVAIEFNDIFLVESGLSWTLGGIRKGRKRRKRRKRGASHVAMALDAAASISSISFTLPFVTISTSEFAFLQQGATVNSVISTSSGRARAMCSVDVELILVQVRVTRSAISSSLRPLTVAGGGQGDGNGNT